VARLVDRPYQQQIKLLPKTIPQSFIKDTGTSGQKAMEGRAFVLFFIHFYTKI
jgi:hypothetical protein